jgi:DNA polymerase I-like protein with 3'-5' exonuclease and polymerase domains
VNAPTPPVAVQRICGLDTETHLIAAGDICPRMVVATFDLADEGRVSPTESYLDTFKAWAVGNAGPEPLAQLLDVFQAAYRRELHIVIQSASYDLAVILRYCQDVIAGVQQGDPAVARELSLLVWDVLERSMDDEWSGGRPLVHCTIIREKLGHLSTHGSVEQRYGRDIRYGLSDLVQRYFGIDISDAKVTMDALGRVFNHAGVDITGTAEAAASWRLRYSQLDGVPLTQWPPEALQYAISDATWARKVWEMQEGNRKPEGYGSMNSEALQVYADLGLRLFSATGFHLDQDRVRRVEVLIDEKLAKVRQVLQLNGVERPNGTINMLVVKERIEKAWEILGRHPMRTDKTGAISASGEALEELAGVDPILDFYMERQEVIKIKTAFLPSIRGAQVWSNYDILKETGRCSSYGSGDRKKRAPAYEAVNIQQMPRAAGVRECFLPPAGYMVCSCDYKALELCSVGQVTYSLLGYSVHRDRNLQGYDLHTYLGASMAMSLSPQLVNEATTAEAAYQALSAARKLKVADESTGEDPAVTAQRARKKEAAHWRNLAKPVGLGYPGGLGPATQVSFAKATYGVVMDVEQAKVFRELWRQTYPEMPEFFRWVEKQTDTVNKDAEGYDTYCYETQGFRRFRAGATFCATANGKSMQSLSADGAKRSVAWIARACMGGLPPESPFSLLADCFPLAFIHDENLVAIPDDELATERSLLVSRLMVAAMQVHMPDVLIEADPALMRRWSKEAGDPEWRDDATRPARVFAALEARRPGLADAVADAIGPTYNPARRLVPWHDLHQEKVA